MPPPPQAAEFLPTATAGKATLKWEQPLAQRAPSAIPGLEPTEWRKVNASMPSLEALSPFMESLTPLIAPIGRFGAAYTALGEALGLPKIKQSVIMRATTVPNNLLSKVMVPVMTTLTQSVPWDRVLDPSTVWVSKGLQAMAFSSEVMETLVKSGKVHRVVPAWKVGLAQGVTDLKMREVDALGDLLNREVAGGGGGALGMGAPTAATRAPASKLEAKLHALGAKLTPEVQSYEAVFSWPKDKTKRPVAPGERDVASPMAPRNVGGGGGAFVHKPAAAGEAAEAKKQAPKSLTIDLGAELGKVKELKALLQDPKRNPFLAADPPRFVADRKQAAAAVVGAKQALSADLTKSLAAKAEGGQQMLQALKAAAAAGKQQKAAAAVAGKKAAAAVAGKA